MEKPKSIKKNKFIRPLDEYERLQLRKAIRAHPTHPKNIFDVDPKLLTRKMYDLWQMSLKQSPSPSPENSSPSLDEQSKDLKLSSTPPPSSTVSKK